MQIGEHIQEEAATDTLRLGQPRAAVPTRASLRDFLGGRRVVAGFVQPPSKSVEQDRSAEHGSGEEQVPDDGVAEER